MRLPLFALLGCLSVFGSAALAQPTITSVGTGTVSPGSIATIFGSGLSAGLSLANSVPLSTALGDVMSVTINGAPAPLMFVSANQIGVQVPWEATPGPANLVVNGSGSSSQAMPIQVNLY